VEYSKPTIIIQSVFVFQILKRFVQFRVHFGVEKRDELEQLDSMQCPGKSLVLLTRIDSGGRGNSGKVRKWWIREGDIGNEADGFNTEKGDAQGQKMLGSGKKPMLVFREQVLAASARVRASPWRTFLVDKNHLQRVPSRTQWRYELASPRSQSWRGFWL
jgi:hypothetical protein